MELNLKYFVSKMTYGFILCLPTSDAIDLGSKILVAYFLTFKKLFSLPVLAGLLIS